MPLLYLEIRGYRGDQAELAIESFFPANEETRLFLHSRAAERPG